MAYNQIYSMVNTIANNISYTGNTVVDISSFVAFGQDVLSTPAGREGVYNQLYNLIGRTIFAIDTAKDEERGIVVDAFTYGSILQKLSFITQQAETSSAWDIKNPQNPYTVQGKQGIVAKYFEQDIPAFAWVDVSYDRQIQQAFRSPESAAGFTDALYVRMYNAYKIAKRGLANSAIAALMAYIYNDTTDLNASRRVRHLLTEYNKAYGTTLTSATALVDKGYLDFIRRTITTDKLNLNEMTHLYNTVGTAQNSQPVDRRSTEDDLNLDLSAALTTAYARYYGETYNEDYIQLPKHNEIVNWGIATSPQEIKISTDGSNDVNITNILGFMYDKDGVVATMDNERFVSKYDDWNERNVFKLSAERRYTCDPTENAIIYLND